MNRPDSKNTLVVTSDSDLGGMHSITGDLRSRGCGTWRKASSRGKGEAIGRYSEKEKKTFLKKGSNNLLNEFHEGRN